MHTLGLMPRSAQAAKIVKLKKSSVNGGGHRKARPYLNPALMCIFRALCYFANSVVPLKAKQMFTVQSGFSPSKRQDWS